MTLQELSDEFDIQFDSIASKSAPALDVYEKSVYLTRAQLEIVKNYYDPVSNRKQKGFENTEKRRSDLRALVKSYTAKDPVIKDYGVSQYSKFYTLPKDVMFIIYERLNGVANMCSENSDKIKIVPMTHDDLAYQLDNPFKKPSHKRAWRLDHSSVDGLHQNVEIVYPNEAKEYFMRYIKYPSPIILEDLNIALPGDNLTINGISTATECELSESIRIEILNRAVELAFGDYSPQNLESKINLDARNE